MPVAFTLDTAEKAFMDQSIAEHCGRPGALLGILEAVQDRNRRKYLPEESLRYIARQMNIPLSRMYSVATFYALFNLDAQGDNTICICRGTACHTRNSRASAGKPAPRAGLGDRGRRAMKHRQANLTSQRWQVHGPHRGLLRAVRAGAGGGS